MEYFWVSVIPSHKREIGIQLMEGRGLKREIRGSNTALNLREDPRKIPKGIATRLETMNPTMTRLVEARTWTNKVPWSTILTARSTIRDGAGRKIGSIKPSLQKISHVSIKNTKEAMLI
jgi:hypothetical protein